MKRVPRCLVCDPRHNPFVQHRVAIVVTAQMSGIARKGPRLDDREHHEQGERGPARCRPNQVQSCHTIRSRRQRNRQNDEHGQIRM
jgi:hypothetical protein